MTLATEHPFIRNQKMVLLAVKDRSTFFYEIHHSFSMTVNIFGDQVKVFRR